MKHRDKVELDDSIRMFVGLDVHKNYLQAAAVDDRGILLKEQRIPNDIHEVKKFFADIDDAKIVIESSSAWYHIYELLSKCYQVVLSNPVKTRAIASAKIKNDSHNEPLGCLANSIQSPLLLKRLAYNHSGSNPVFQEFAPTKRIPYSRSGDGALSLFRGASSS